MITNMVSIFISPVNGNYYSFFIGNDRVIDTDDIYDEDDSYFFIIDNNGNYAITDDGNIFFSSSEIETFILKIEKEGYVDNIGESFEILKRKYENEIIDFVNIFLNLPFFKQINESRFIEYDNNNYFISGYSYKNNELQSITLNNSITLDVKELELLFNNGRIKFINGLPVYIDFLSRLIYNNS